MQRSHGFRVVRKYLLTLGGIRHALSHLRQFQLMCHYHAQSVEKGRACVIEVIPFQIELLNNESGGVA